MNLPLFVIFMWMEALGGWLMTVVIEPQPVRQQHTDRTSHVIVGLTDMFPGLGAVVEDGTFFGGGGGRGGV